MSSESLAALRRHAGSELADLAEEHFKHDLTEDDRQKLQSAASTLSTYAAVGSMVGLGLGAFLAFRLRRRRADMFKAMRAQERPTHVQFANGRTEPLPDLTPYLAPTTFGDIATYTFFGAGGLFLFGEMGALLGTVRARGVITGDPESKKRIENAFKKFKADILRKQLKELEGETSTLSEMAGGLLS